MKLGKELIRDLERFLKMCDNHKGISDFCEAQSMYCAELMSKHNINSDQLQLYSEMVNFGIYDVTQYMSSQKIKDLEVPLDYVAIRGEN